MNKLTQLVREIVDTYLEEENEKKYTGASSFGYKVADKAKADKVKSIYDGHYIADLIQAVEDAGEQGITRDALSKFLSEKTGKNITREKLNPDLQSLSLNGVLTRGRPEKAAKEPSSGQRGRKSSDTSKAGKIRTLFQKFKDDPNYEPTEDDITYTLPKGLGTEKMSPGEVNKTKNSALGTTKLGRPAFKSKDDELSGLKDIMKEQINEQFLRMQKLAGL